MDRCPEEWQGYKIGYQDAVCFWTFYTRCFIDLVLNFRGKIWEKVQRNMCPQMPAFRDTGCWISLSDLNNIIVILSLRQFCCSRRFLRVNSTFSVRFHFKTRNEMQIECRSRPADSKNCWTTHNSRNRRVAFSGTFTSMNLHLCYRAVNGRSPSIFRSWHIRWF